MLVNVLVGRVLVLMQPADFLYFFFLVVHTGMKSINYEYFGLHNLSCVCAFVAILYHVLKL